MTTASSNGHPLVQTLIETLEKEHDALTTLADALDRQLSILRDEDLNDLEAATRQTSEATAALEQVSTARKRQMRLTRRMLDIGDEAALDALADATEAQHNDPASARRLRTLQRQIHESAHRIQTVSDELEYALQYAASVGQEMIAFLRGGTSSPAAQGYTERGDHSTPEPESVLNQIG